MLQRCLASLITTARYYEPRLLDGGRIGGDERVEFAEQIPDLAPVKIGDQQVDAPDPAQIAVERLAVVIVFSPHDLVAGGECRTEALDLLPDDRIKSVLEIGVERRSAKASPSGKMRDADARP